VIVHVPAEIDDDRRPRLPGDVPGGTHVVERVALEHEVIDSLRAVAAEQGDRVVTRVAMQEHRHGMT